MRRFVLLFAVLAAAIYPAVILAGPGGSDNGTACSLSTQLRGENEVPPRVTEVFGHTLINVRNDGTVEWDTHIVNPAGDNLIAGHIHEAAAGVNGPVRVPLFPAPSGTDAQVRDRGETAPGNAFATAICANPAGFYVNYHSTTYPGGVIRGQLG